MANLCTECGIDMGNTNPRQLCGKTSCLNTAIIIDDNDISDDNDNHHNDNHHNDNHHYGNKQPVTKKPKQLPVKLIRQNAYSDKWNTPESIKTINKLLNKLNSK